MGFPPHTQSVAAPSPKLLWTFMSLLTGSRPMRSFRNNTTLNGNERFSVLAKKLYSVVFGSHLTLCFSTKPQFKCSGNESVLNISSISDRLFQKPTWSFFAFFLVAPRSRFLRNIRFVQKRLYDLLRHPPTADGNI